VAERRSGQAFKRACILIKRNMCSSMSAAEIVSVINEVDILAHRPFQKSVLESIESA